MLEERRNEALRRTLETVGSDASRHVFDAFPGVLIHSFEPRRGAPLMEWVARELSLVDLAIAIDGLPVELARWIANLDHEMLVRVFLTYRPEELTDERAAELELERYDAIFATSEPAAGIDWQPIAVSIAPQDSDAIPAEYLPKVDEAIKASPESVARALETVIRSSIAQQSEDDHR